MNTPKLPPPPEREAFEAWMQGDATISLEKDGHGYVDMTAELMWHAWKAASKKASGVQQEPVAWIYTSKLAGNEKFMTRYASDLSTYKADQVTPLYTNPEPQQKPLTDEQIEAIYTQETGSLIDNSPWALVDFVRAIEAAHNIGDKK